MKLIDIIKTTNENIFLYGEGGAGKTTVLVDLHKKLLVGIQTLRIIPIYIPLRNYDGKNFLKNYIIYHYITPSKGDTDDGVELYKKLKDMIENCSNYCFLLILDGLNEISVNTKEIYTEINAIAEWKNLRVLVSSRYDIKEELKSFLRYKIMPIDEDYVKNNIEEYYSLSQNLKKLLLTPFYYVIYKETNVEKRKTVSNAGQLLRLHYQEMISRSNRTEHREFSELIVFDFIPYICFNLSLTGALSISKEEASKLFKDWVEHLTYGEDDIKIIDEFGRSRFKYIENICGYGIASYENEQITFYEINRDFFGAYYEKNKTKTIAGDEYAEAANRNILFFVEELNNKKYKNLIIPNGVVKIRDSAFATLTDLSSVIIPYGVKDLGIFAFAGCGIQNITIPNSTTCIGSYAFASSRLNRITIPDSVTWIGNDAFKGCSELVSVNLTNSITKIEMDTFAKCYKLTTIKIPNMVKEIGKRAFEGCKSLISVNIPNSVTTIDKFAFSNCSQLKMVLILKGTKNISTMAFDGCENIHLICRPLSCANKWAWFMKKLRDEAKDSIIGIPEIKISFRPIIFNLFKWLANITLAPIMALYTIKNSINYETNIPGFYYNAGLGFASISGKEYDVAEEVETENYKYILLQEQLAPYNMLMRKVKCDSGIIVMGAVSYKPMELLDDEEEFKYAMSLFGYTTKKKNMQIGI